MADSQRTVLIDGCSNGSMGAELAKEFHKAGLKVYATARDTSKMGELSSLGIATLQLDIVDDSSIENCMKQLPDLDILINNAGISYTSPVVDISIPEAKKLFDCNVWGHIGMTQACIPLLLKSSKQPMIVNHTSVGADLAIPFQSTYNASKAAMAKFSETMRLELQAFGITVVELKTGGVKTNFIKNVQAQQPELPPNSIFAPAKEEVKKALRGEWAEKVGIPAEQWAKATVADLLRASAPPVIWRGENAFMARVASVLPFGWLDNAAKRMTGLDKVERIIRSH